MNVMFITYPFPEIQLTPGGDQAGHGAIGSMDMNAKLLLLAVSLFTAPVLHAASPRGERAVVGAQTQLPSESTRKVTAGRILLKWGPYVEKVKGLDRRDWAAAMWPSLQGADLGNLQKASQAITYEGMRNALLGQRPYESQLIDQAARTKSSGSLAMAKSLGDLGADLVFTPVTPCRIVDTRVIGGRLAINSITPLDASNPGGNFSSQGGSNSSDCGVPANPAALALSVTALDNLTTGYIRVYPYDKTNAHGSPISINTVMGNVNNDIVVPSCQGCTQELRVFSTANTHYAAFVTGYFMAPQASALDCTTAQNAGFLDLLSILQPKSVSCPAGYTATGGGCGGPLGITVSNSKPLTAGGVPTGWRCDLVGSLLGAIAYEVNATCCRTPGR